MESAARRAFRAGVVIPCDVFCLMVLPPALNCGLCCAACALMLLGARQYMVDERVLPVAVHCFGCEEPSPFGKLFLRCSRGSGPGSESCEAHLQAMRDLEAAKKKLAEAMAKLRKIQEMFAALLRRCTDLYRDVRGFFGSFSFSVSLNFSWGGLPKLKLGGCGAEVPGIGKVDPCSDVKDAINGIIGGINSALRAVGRAIGTALAALLRPIMDLVSFVKRFIAKMLNRVMDALSELRRLGRILNLLKEFFALLRRLDPSALVYDLAVEPMGLAIQRALPFMSLGDALRTAMVLAVAVLALFVTGILAVYAFSAYFSVVAVLL